MKFLKPHKIIGEKYLRRWHLIPRNKYSNTYLHHFIGNDDDRALHDHPWHSFSIRIWGKLREVYHPEGSPIWVTRTRMVPRFCFRKATYAHRLELVDGKPAWTIFFTGPVIRKWGFLCPRGWQIWTTMTNSKGEKIGGCE